MHTYATQHTEWKSVQKRAKGDPANITKKSERWREGSRRSSGGGGGLLSEELALLVEDLLEREVAGDPGRNVDDQDLHLGVIDEVGKKLGRKEEVPETGEGVKSASDAFVDNEQQVYALSDIVTAGRLDEHLVHIALRTLIHSLVDLVHQRERRARKLGEREKVRDRRQSALL